MLSGDERKDKEEQKRQRTEELRPNTPPANSAQDDALSEFIQSYERLADYSPLDGNARFVRCVDALKKWQSSNASFDQRALAFGFIVTVWERVIQSKLNTDGIHLHLRKILLFLYAEQRRLREQFPELGKIGAWKFSPLIDAITEWNHKVRCDNLNAARLLFVKDHDSPSFFLGELKHRASNPVRLLFQACRLLHATSVETAISILSCPSPTLTPMRPSMEDKGSSICCAPLLWVGIFVSDQEIPESNIRAREKRYGTVVFTFDAPDSQYGYYKLGTRRFMAEDSQIWIARPSSEDWTLIHDGKEHPLSPEPMPYWEMGYRGQFWTHPELVYLCPINLAPLRLKIAFVNHDSLCVRKQHGRPCADCDSGITTAAKSLTHFATRTKRIQQRLKEEYFSPENWEQLQRQWGVGSAHSESMV